MNDDQMDELLRQSVRDYNEPGAVPREEMWKRISAERASWAARGSPLVARRSSRWVWPSAAVAAAVLLAAGVVIGRRMDRGAPAAVVPGVIVAAPPVMPAPPADTARPARDSNAEIIRELRKQNESTNRRVRALASTGAPSGRVTSDEPRANSDDLTYHLVVLQHLAGSEALITSFRSSAKRGEVDAQLAAWSRELLSTTRMLEATAVTRDPTMRRLLEDLDLVISQITQYVTRGTNNSDDLDLIEQSINKRGVIPKLRSTLPAGNRPAGI
jgi:hypothetical protein